MIRAAVLGSPISHSLSPQLHKIAYEILGIQADYSRFDVKSGGLPDFLVEHPELDALSLTMPLKEEALLIADSVSQISSQIQSGNTLSKKDGIWNLTSTDVEGFIQALKVNNFSSDGTALIIGSGATARACVAALASVDRIQKGKIHVIHRNPDREKQMRAAAPLIDLEFHIWDSFPIINDTSLVVNTTPAGIADAFCDFVDKPRGLYFEALYNPWPTLLFDRWGSQGAGRIDGIDLLVHQAISQVEIFTGISVDRKSLSSHMRLKALELLDQSTGK
jgi:shikimate dehydrogenase